MIIIKVGGSLFERADCRQKLNEFLQSYEADHVVLIAGGGDSAEAVRSYDRIHQLGEAISHRLATLSMGVTAELLRELTDYRYHVLDAVGFALNDQTLPHSWSVTSDSIAARYAETIQAQRLILLKSVTIHGVADWPAAVANGWVDDYFPMIAKRLTCPIEIQSLNS